AHARVGERAAVARLLDAGGGVAALIDLAVLFFVGPVVADLAVVDDFGVVGGVGVGDVGAPAAGPDEHTEGEPEGQAMGHGRSERPPYTTNPRMTRAKHRAPGEIRVPRRSGRPDPACWLGSLRFEYAGADVEVLERKGRGTEANHRGALDLLFVWCDGHSRTARD